MKTIKIFVASSEELKEERELMASLANDLSTKLEKIGIQVIAVEWENLDSSMGEPHKQEEYNEKLRECEMCMVLYWTKFGKYTKTELETAYKEKVNGKNPQKLWVYFKEVNDPTKEITNELKEFRDSFPIKYGHFYTPFANFDTLKAHFLLQFVEYQSQELQGKSIVEVKDGKVTVGGKMYVDLQNVPFAGNNKEYKDKLSQLKTVKKILTITDEDDPDYKDYQEQLKTLHKEIKEMEEGLWDTALMITRLSNTRCSERLKRAADLFEKGDNNGARAVLNEEEIEHDIEHNLNLIKLGEEGKEGLKTNIEELSLKMRLLRTADFKFKDDKYNQIETVFKKELKCTIALYGEESVDHYKLLKCSRRYLHEQPIRYIPYLNKAMEISKREYGISSDETISLYKDLIWGNGMHGLTNKVFELYKEVLPVIMDKYGEYSEEYYSWLSNYGKRLVAEKNFSEAGHVLKKCVELCRNSHNFIGIKKSYNDLALMYLRSHNIPKVEEVYDEYISEQVDKSNPTALLYEYLEIARYLERSSSFSEKYYKKALDIALKLNDKSSLVDIYKGISEIRLRLADYCSEISYLEKAFEICNDMWKYEILTRLANSYTRTGDYNNALKCAEQSIEYYAVSRCQSSRSNPQIEYFKLLTKISRSFNDFEKAEYYAKHGLEYSINQGSRISTIYYFFEELGIISCRVGNYDKALDYYNQAIQYSGDKTDLYRRTRMLSRIGWVYRAMGDNAKAEAVYRESIALYKEEEKHLNSAPLGDKNRNLIGLARTHADICRFFLWTSQFDKAQNSLSKSLEYSKSKAIGLMDRDLLQARIYVGKGMYEDAIKQLEGNKPDEQLKYQWQNIMAEAYINWGKNPEALEWTNLLLQEYVDDPFVHEMAGDYYAKFGDEVRAIEHYEFGLNLLIKNRISRLAENRFRTKIEQIKNSHNIIDN